MTNQIFLGTAFPPNYSLSKYLRTQRTALDQPISLTSESSQEVSQQTRRRCVTRGVARRAEMKNLVWKGIS